MMTNANVSTKRVDTLRLYGPDALDYAMRKVCHLSKGADPIDPTEGARDDVTIAEAKELCALDRRSVFVDLLPADAIVALAENLAIREASWPTQPAIFEGEVSRGELEQLDRLLGRSANAAEVNAFADAWMKTHDEYVARRRARNARGVAR